jgi:predicted O-linked N-acetylglucosamine transferase (SPINDLY family)
VPTSSSATLKQQAIERLQAGRVSEAIPLLDSLVRTSAQDAEAWCLLGTAQGIAGNHDAAIRACEQAIAIRADYPEAWCNLGASQHDLRRFDDAIASFSRAVQLRPDYLGALYNLGNSLNESGRVSEAIAYYERALALRPDANIHVNLGSTYEKTARFDRAAEHYRQALALDPRHPKAHNNLGNVLFKTGQADIAADHYRRALALDANYAEAHNNLGVYLARCNRVTEAIDHYRRATENQPAFAEAWNNLANAELSRCRLAQAHEAYREATRLQPHNMLFSSNRLFAMNYDASISARDVAQAHAEWGRTQNKQAAPAARTTDRLRIGYVSPDFRAHPIAYFIANVLANHDPASVEIFCYANVARPDAVTERLRSMAPNWRSIGAWDTDRVCTQIRADCIDILVDLAGHGEDNRLDVFARRAAPVQATWLGYPNTTGLQNIDYSLTDPVLAPDTDETLHTETLIRLPLFCCYEPPREAPDVAPAPCLKNNYVTFGSFQNIAKLGEPVVHAWAEILRQTPTARLMMQARGFADSQIKRDFLDRFAARGISADRLDLRGPTAFIEHLRDHRDIDIALDPFPWNGHTTTCHALWMGVPVIAVTGNAHASRMASDMLHAVGLDELIVTDIDAYVGLAVRLTTQIDRITQLRREIRGKMQRSDLCNGRLFAARLEEAYREMWSRSSTHRGDA